MSKRITICLVTANRPNYLKKSLLSIKNLEYQDFELIVSDDSTNEKSKKIVKKIFPKAKYYLNRPSLGEIRNSNFVIAKAKTEWICLFHDDDELEPKYFNTLVTEIEKDPSIDVAYTGRNMIDENDKVIAIQKLKKKSFLIYSAKSILDFMLLGTKIENYIVPINTPGLLFKKALFNKVGGFSTIIDTHCDTNLLLKLLSVSKNVLFVNDLLFNNRIWVGLSGRTKSSERGDVLQAQKGVIIDFLDFCRLNNCQYPNNQNIIFSKFYNDSVSINGPLLWIALRFTGSYVERIKSIFETSKEIILNDKRTIVRPIFYMSLIISLLPQKVLKILQKLFLQNFIKKS